MIKELKQWDKATDNLARYFIKKYFGEGIDNYYYWIGSQNEDKEVLAIGDYLFDLNDIVNFIRYDYSATEMFEYYDYRIGRN